MEGDHPYAGRELQRLGRGVAVVHYSQEHSAVASPNGEDSVVEPGAGDKPTLEMACGYHEREGGHQQYEGCWLVGK